MDRALWYDLSPMRPDEWARTSVERFNAAVQMRQAYEEGAKLVKDEQEGAKQAIDRLKQRAGMGHVG